MNEQTKAELLAKLEELKAKEAVAWAELKNADNAINLAALETAKEAKSKEWYSIHKAVDGIKALLKLEGE